MKEKSIDRLINIFVIISGILLLSYTAFRSASLSFTHDESYTYIKYIHFSVWEIITYKIHPVIANNHVLNTLCMKWQSFMFGNSEFSLRLHSWIAHIFYIIFSYLILKETKSKTIIICGFILLNFNTYLLDFFSLARGYALSITLMTASLYCFTLYIKHKKHTTLIFSLLTALIGVLANFSLMSYTASLIIVFELLFILEKGKIKSILLKNIPIIITILIMMLIYKGPIKVLISNNQLNFGGETGLWEDTVISSICSYIYTPPYSDFSLWTLKFLITFVALSSFVVIFIQFKNKSQNYLSYITIILILILLSNVFQHFFLNGSYFSNRFALFLVPLFFLSFINIIYFLMKKKNWLRFSGYTISLYALTCCLNISSNSINISSYCNWTYDANIKDMLTDLSSEKKGCQKIKLGITWLFEPTINFYRETKNYNWLEPVNREGLNGNYDFYYVESADLTSFDTTNKTLLKSYPKSEATLYKARNNN